VRFVLHCEANDKEKESIMFSKQRPTMSRAALKYAVLFLLIVALSWMSLSGEAILGSVFAYIAPTAQVDRAQAGDRPGIANRAMLRPWSEYLSEDAVDAAGIETDLDGNASALYTSDWCGRAACGNPSRTSRWL
jgi:hypothetical protein